MIEVDRKLFVRALDLAGAAVSRRDTIPVLASLKVSANGALRLEGTDLDNTTCAEMAYTGEEGEFLLPAPKRLRGALGQSGGDAVRLAPADRTLRIQAGKLDSSLITLAADDFPPQARIGFEEFSATLGAAELRQIARLMPAMSTEETRYYLHGICVWHLGDWTYRFAATNGHMLMIVDVPLPDAAGTLPERPILPRSWLKAAIDRLGKVREGVRFTLGRLAIPNTEGPELPLQPGGLRIAMKGDLDGIAYSVTGKLIDGHYPDVMRVIPAEQRYRVRLNRAELVKAVHALTSLTFEKRARAIKLTFPPNGVRCELYSPELGRSCFDIDAEHTVTPDMREIGFNSEYLLAMCGAVAGAEIEIGLTNPGDPATITDPADTAFKGVLMPMRV